MTVVLATQENIRKASQVLSSGGVVAFPTETVYGLGCDATNKEAVSRVYTLKNRPNDNPLIAHVSTTEEAKKITIGWDDRCDQLGVVPLAHAEFQIQRIGLLLGQHLEEDRRLPLLWERRVRAHLVGGDLLLEPVDGGGDLGHARTAISREETRHAVELEAAALGIVPQVQPAPGVEAVFLGALHEDQRVASGEDGEQLVELTVGLLDAGERRGDLR